MRQTSPFWRRFLIAAAAVILGNAIYLSFQRFLPGRAYHKPFRIDLGLVADFWLCLIIFYLLLALLRSKH